MSDINKEKLLEDAKSIVEGILRSNPNTSLGDVLSNTNNSADTYAEKYTLNVLKDTLKDKGRILSIFYYILYPVFITLYFI